MCCGSVFPIFFLFFVDLPCSSQFEYSGFRMFLTLLSSSKSISWVVSQLFSSRSCKLFCTGICCTLDKIRGCVIMKTLTAQAVMLSVSRGERCVDFGDQWNHSFWSPKSALRLPRNTSLTLRIWHGHWARTGRCKLVCRVTQVTRVWNEFERVSQSFRRVSFLGAAFWPEDCKSKYYKSVIKQNPHSWHYVNKICTQPVWLMLNLTIVR